MSDSTAQSVRQLKIKTGVVKRYHKEEAVYRDEVVSQKKIVEQYKAEGKDGADIRAAERVLKDSEMMVPKTRQALQDAYQALEDLVGALASEEAVANTDEYRQASSQLQEVEAAWNAESN
ncbi:hypothetical protein IAT38_002652 [Cryptococcus sp. DSM 104549]